MVSRHLVSVSLLVLVAGCSSSSSSDGAGGAGGECKSGANAAYADPAGTPYALPDGITLESATDEAVQGNCFFDVKPIEYGGDIIDVCLKLKNGTAAPITVTLPAGLVFKPADAKRMNGILLQSHDVIVKAGETKQVFVKQTSINEHCVFTDPAPTSYTIATVTTDPALREVIELVKDKETSSDTIMTTQTAVWNVTDRGGLTGDDRTAIAAMPAAKQK